VREYEVPDPRPRRQVLALLRRCLHNRRDPRDPHTDQGTNANAFAERWVETLRADCLDWVLVFGPRHLDRVLRTYVEHYNQRRPHRGLQLLAPESAASPADLDTVPHIQRRDRLGGLIHEYECAHDRVFAPHDLGALPVNA
jgi:transposase InsO family protein